MSKVKQLSLGKKRNYYSTIPALILIILSVFGIIYANNYNSKAAAPTITSITPNQGPTAGGTNVTMTGDDFTIDYSFYGVYNGD